MKVDKVIMTNFKVLRNKYAAAGVSKIRDGISKLIAADKKRGLATRLIALDDPGAMREFSTRSVSNPKDPKQNKIAIDAVYKALAPDYMMILGAADVVPHQDLKNPAFSRARRGDHDKIAYGDLPYACEHTYSRRARDFVGPTRVVGRLPDLKGGKDPHYILDLLETASNYSASAPERYRSYFSISAEIWKKSTTLSLKNVFGSASGLGTVPPEDDQWSSQLLRRLSHFINCHGATTDPKFYGQPASGEEKYPVAFTAGYAKSKIKRGTIAATECCYGGQLYDPSSHGGQMGICNTYLAKKAYGFFASTTIAYGPEDYNAQADLICQYFLRNILTGASLGRAALEARQRFVQKASPPHPIDLKTLAQFNLYGDPSLAPVTLPAAKKVVGAIPKAMVVAERVERSERRRSLFRQGVELMTSVPVPHLVRTPPAKSIRSKLTREALQLNVRPTDFLPFVVQYPARTTRLMPKALVHKEVVPTGFYIVFGETATVHGQASVTRRKWAEMEGPPQIIALVAKEVNGKIVSVKKTVSR